MKHSSIQAYRPTLPGRALSHISKNRKIKERSGTEEENQVYSRPQKAAFNAMKCSYPY